MSRRLKTSQNLERLEKEENIPKVLSSEIRNFFPSEKDENNKMKCFTLDTHTSVKDEFYDEFYDGPT